MKPDTNTKSHCQWFFFKVKNKSINIITIIIKNFIKKTMFYNKGLKPYYKSLISKKNNY